MSIKEFFFKKVFIKSFSNINFVKLIIFYIFYKYVKIIITKKLKIGETSLIL